MLVEKRVNLKALRFQIGQIDVLPEAGVLVHLSFSQLQLRILLLVWRALVVGALTGALIRAVIG